MMILLIATAASPNSMSNFKILKKSKKTDSRLGVINTAHGKIKTPFFMPDATRGYVKALSISDLESSGVEAAVVNTYHLYLQPGIKLIKKAGGIHSFMNWKQPLLSDSGGFQVFSLAHRAKMGKITDKSVIFKSPLDGSMHELTPEKAIKIQFDLGVDMMVCLDDCPPNSSTTEQLQDSVARTIAWAQRCKIEYAKQVKKRKLKIAPLLFAVIQGGNDLELRKSCAESLVAIGFDGYGFGAMPTNAAGEFSDEILKYTASLIPEQALRFALGIGRPQDIVKCFKYGWDMFDCVIPTREGRHGRIFQEHKNKLAAVNIKNAKFISDFSVINKDSKILSLRTHTKAFLNHLFRMDDTSALRLASLNNLEIYNNLLAKIRKNFV